MLGRRGLSEVEAAAAVDVEAFKRRRPRLRLDRVRHRDRAHRRGHGGYERVNSRLVPPLSRVRSRALWRLERSVNLIINDKREDARLQEGRVPPCSPKLPNGAADQLAALPVRRTRYQYTHSSHPA